MSVQSYDILKRSGSRSLAEGPWCRVRSRWTFGQVITSRGAANLRQTVSVSDTTTTGQPKLTRRHAYVFVVLGLLVLAFLVGTRYPHTVEMSVLCDTTSEEVRCHDDDGFLLHVSDDGVWQDANHIWRSGRPDCLKGTGDDVGPVTLGVVEGGDDGMAWRQVVWVGCP
jgi:hypothetical protein